MKLPYSDDFKYITLSQLMSSVSSDLHQYDDGGLIDSDKVIKVVKRCNEKLGYAIYQHKEVILDVTNYKVELPADFYKIEMLFGVFTDDISTTPLLGSRQLDFSSTPPADKSQLITVNKTACVDICNNCVFVTERNHDTNVTIRYSKVIPMSISNSSNELVTSYSPNLGYKRSNYTVDLKDGYIHTTFKTGKVHLCYLAELVNEEGELLIPQHPLLNDYYEWSVKYKIFEDIFMNSEAEVVNKMQLAQKRASESYIDAWNFVSTLKKNQWESLEESRKRNLYNKFYKIFT